MTNLPPFRAPRVVSGTCAGQTLDEAWDMAMNQFADALDRYVNDELTPALTSPTVVRPGDTLVFAVKEPITNERTAAIREHVEPLLPGVTIVIVVAEQMLVYRPAGEAQ